MRIACLRDRLAKETEKTGGGLDTMISKKGSFLREDQLEHVMLEKSRMIVWRDRVGGGWQRLREFHLGTGRC